MPRIYNRKLSPGESTTDPRGAKPVNGGIDVFKAQGNLTSYKITAAAIKAVSEEYGANTLEDLLKALHKEEAKGSGNRLAALEVEGAYHREFKAGSSAFDKSKEGVAGIKNHITAARDKKSFTGTAKATAQSTAAAKK